MSRSSGDAFANGPSQPSLGAHPPNPVFMPLPQPGYANSIPNKGPIPPGPASFNTHRLSSAGSMPAASADLMPPSTSFMSPTGSFMPASSPALMPGLTPATSHGLMPPPSGLMPASSPGLLPPASSGSVPAFDVAASSGLLLGSMPASPGHRTVQGIQGPSPALGYAHNASGWSGATLPPPAQSTSTASGYNTHGISGTHALNAPALHQAFGAPAVLRGPPPPPPAGAVHHAGGQSIGTSLQTNHSSMNTALPPPAYSNYNQQNHCQQNQYQHQNHQYQNQHLQPSSLSGSLAGLSLGSGAPEALKPINLLQERNVLPPGAVKPPTPCLPQDQQRLNCCPEVFRCTLTSIPQTQSLLNKAKLPLGLLLHPFKDLSQLPVVTSSNIVRCRSCRTYINPFVSFINPTRWKCNLCHRVNEVPEEFMYNPVSKSYGSPHKRPEVQNATIEFIAPSEYMLRPPQPAVYLFVLDVSHNAVETGYLEAFSRCLLDNLDSLPGDARTKIGFITFDSTIHFYNLQEGLSRPQMLMVSEIDDVFLPSQEGLLVNLNESKELVRDLLVGLPELFNKTMQTHSALGPALQAAFKLLAPTGGRVSVCVTQLPNLGTGALRPREESGQKTKETVQNLSPSTDFYKKLALDCSGHQVAVDLFLLSSQYCDLASIGCVSRYSAGSVYYYPSYHKQHNPCQTERFQKDLKRYLTRKIGFEGVMRIRCTKGLSIHTFHGNFFVRSTDLLSLANVNPDAGFAVQMSIDENLVDLQSVSFQAALLYTSSRGERRIRVHTLCLPVVNSLSDIFAGADVQAITALLANMAVDRCVSSSLSDARDALMNAVLDLLSSYKSSELHVNQQHTGVMVPGCLRVSPLHTLALLKHKAFRAGSGQRIDDRVFSLIQLKQQPLAALMINIHPNLYRVDQLDDEGALNVNDCTIPQPPVLQLSAEKLSRDGAFLMDCGSVMYLWVGRNCSSVFLSQVLGVENYTQIPLDLMELPELDSPESSRLRSFINWLRERRPLHTLLHIVREESALKAEFLLNLIEDSSESGLSYYDFLLHLQKQSSK